MYLRIRIRIRVCVCNVVLLLFHSRRTLQSLRKPIRPISLWQIFESVIYDNLRPNSIYTGECDENEPSNYMIQLKPFETTFVIKCVSLSLFQSNPHVKWCA